MSGQRPHHLPPGGPSPRRRTGLLVGLVVFAVAALGVAVLFDSSADDGTATEAVSQPIPTLSPEQAPSTTEVPSAASDDVAGPGEPITIAFAGDSNFEGNLRTRLDRDPETAIG